MKIFALVLSFLLIANGVADVAHECDAFDEAMGACMDAVQATGLGVVDHEACDACITTAVTAAVTNQVTCDLLAGGRSGLCNSLAACHAPRNGECPAQCIIEAQAYALCKVNEELGNGCEAITCASATGEP